MRLLLLSCCFVAASATAQKTEAPQKRAPVQIIDITDGDLIEGGLAGPMGQIYLTPHQSRFGSLIKLRMNFDDKLRESVHEM